jgi:hypothetical protein
MRRNNALLVALLAVASFGAGVTIGWKLGLRKDSPSAQIAPAAGAQAGPSTAIKGRPTSSSPGKMAGARDPISLAEIEAAILKAVHRGGNRASKTLNDLVQSVNPPDIPQLLVFVDKLASANYRSQLRTMVLGHWAETDVSAAMVYAEKLPGFQNRQQAILAVLRSWAETEAEAAAA